MQEFSIWNAFYMIIGSSGAVLIGLQFVILALIADMRIRTSAESIGAFGTPTVVHFGLVLLISALMSAPWSSPAPLSVALVWCGLGGLAYSATIIPRARR